MAPNPVALGEFENVAPVEATLGREVEVFKTSGECKVGEAQARL
jgi:hypothetical protein